MTSDCRHLTTFSGTLGHWGHPTLSLININQFLTDIAFYFLHFLSSSGPGLLWGYPSLSLININQFLTDIAFYFLHFLSSSGPGLLQGHWGHPTLSLISSFTFNILVKHIGSKSKMWNKRLSQKYNGLYNFCF